MIKFIEQSTNYRKLTNEERYEGNIRSDFRTKEIDGPKSYYTSDGELLTKPDVDELLILCHQNTTSEICFIL